MVGETGRTLSLGRAAGRPIAATRRAERGYADEGGTEW